LFLKGEDLRKYMNSSSLIFLEIFSQGIASVNERKGKKKKNTEVFVMTGLTLRNENSLRAIW
jgi:hypothetical protein